MCPCLAKSTQCFRICKVEQFPYHYINCTGAVPPPHSVRTRMCLGFNSQTQTASLNWDDFSGSHASNDTTISNTGCIKLKFNDQVFSCRLFWVAMFNGNPRMRAARQAALHMVPAQGKPKEMVGAVPGALDIWGYPRVLMGLIIQFTPEIPKRQGVSRAISPRWWSYVVMMMMVFCILCCLNLNPIVFPISSWFMSMFIPIHDDVQELKDQP